MSRDTLWRCPVCGRPFSKPNQQHSHLSCNVEAHFKGKPEQKALFDALIARIEDLGPMRVDAVKTSINLIARRHFGGVRVLRGGLRLGFVRPHFSADLRRQAGEHANATRPPSPWSKSVVR